MLISFLIDYFTSKSLDYLLESKDSMHSSLMKVYENLRTKHIKQDVVGDDEIIRHHFIGDTIFEEGIIKLTFDDQYTLVDLCNEMSASNNIFRFTTSEVDCVVDDFYILCKQDSELCRLIICKEIKVIKKDVNGLINPNLIISSQKFIEESCHPILSLSIPLNNKFYGRDKELKEGIQSLSTNDILIIDGASGAGKTKLALELCLRYTEQNPEYKFVCLKSICIQDTYVALNKLIDECKKIIILIDDANRVGGNYPLILQTLTTVEVGTMKVVATVRDYACNLIYKKSQSYRHASITIENLTSEEITAILNSSDFDIQNFLFTNKINRIAEGNIRIAIMCAIIAKQSNNIDSLNNVYDVFEAYYGPIYNELISKHNVYSLKVLGIIAFFRAINRENTTLLEEVYDVCNISEDTFWEVCTSLDNVELVELWENNVVKMSDQTLMTYIGYRIFFKDKLISYSEMLKRFIEYDAKIVDNLYSIVNSFNYESIKKDVESAISVIWDNSDYDKSFKICNIFYPFIPIKAISLVKRYIDNMESLNSEYIFNIGNNSFNQTPLELSLLSELGTTATDYTNSALELMFRYVQKSPQQAAYLIKLLKDQWKIDVDSNSCGFYLQHMLSDYFKTHYTEDTILYSNVILHTAPVILNTFIRNVSVKRNKFCTVSGYVSSNSSLKDLRQKYWGIIFTLSPEYTIKIGQLLLSNDIRYNRETADILKFDVSIVSEWFITSLDRDNFIHCYIVHKYNEHFRYMKVDESITNKFTCKLWYIYSLFQESTDVKKDWSKHITERFNRLVDYCKLFNYNDYIKFISDLEYIIAIEKLFVVNTYSDYIDDVLFYAAYNNDIYIFEKLLIKRLQTNPDNTSYNRIYGYINNQKTDIDKLIYKINNSLVDPIKTKVLAYIYAYIPEEKVTKQHTIDLMKLLRDSSLVGVKIHSGLLYQYAERYSKMAPSEVIWEYILSKLCKKIDQGLILNIDKDIFEGKLVNIDHKVVFKIFMHCKNNVHSEYTHNVMKYLLSIDVLYFIRYIKITYKDEYINIYNSDFSYIWDLDNCGDIVDSYLNFAQKPENRLSLHIHNLSVLFGGENPDKQIYYLQQKMKEDINNAEFVFDVVSESLRGYIVDFIELLLSLTSDFKVFKDVNIGRRSYSYIGSEVPIHQSELDIFKRIKEVIIKQPSQVAYIDHLEYIDKLIGYKQADVDRIRKKEFLYE